MFLDKDYLRTMRWARADAMAICIAVIWAMTATHGHWTWFAALFLGPDLSMTAYLLGSRVGAVAYNAAPGPRMGRSAVGRTVRRHTQIVCT
jgi:hypothetical protein